MDDTLVAQLIAVCRAITDDGELTDKELYSLAEWLNEHPDACEVWPGNILVKPLQKVWADGKITKTELQRIGRLLFEIEREWARRVMAAATEEVLLAFDASSAALPRLPIRLSVASTSGGDSYDVNLTDASCNCPDWTNHRTALPPLHLSRCCKHVIKALAHAEPDAGWPGWLSAVLNDCIARDRGTGPWDSWYVLAIADSAILISASGGEWANVFAPDGAIYFRYGFNTIEDRWAYGQAPRNARTIIKAIRTVV